MLLMHSPRLCGVSPRRPEASGAGECDLPAPPLSRAATKQWTIPPDAATQAKLRQQARNWLKSELGAWFKLLHSDPPHTNGGIAQTLRHWQEDTDLAGVRRNRGFAKAPGRGTKAVGGSLGRGQGSAQENARHTPLNRALPGPPALVSVGS